MRFFDPYQIHTNFNLSNKLYYKIPDKLTPSQSTVLGSSNIHFRYNYIPCKGKKKISIKFMVLSLT